MIVPARTYAHRIQQISTQLDVPLPRQFVATLAAAAKLTEDTERLEGHTGELNAAVIEVLLGGGDPAQDPQVQKLAVFRTVGDAGIRAAGADKAARMIEQSIAENADTIIGQWIAAVRDDCTYLANIVSALDDIEDLRTVDAAAVSRTGRLAVWQAALTALDRARTAHEGQRTFIAAVGVPVQRQHMALLLADADIDEVDRINARAANPDPWTVVKVTGQLDLADITALRARIDQYEAGWQLRLREQEADRMSGFDGQRRRKASVI